MSTETVSEIKQKTCDACGKVERFEMVGADREVIAASAKWFRVLHLTYSAEHDQFLPMIGEACSLDCVPVVAVKISALTPESQDKIDMNALRAANPAAN